MLSASEWTSSIQNHLNSNLELQYFADLQTGIRCYFEAGSSRNEGLAILHDLASSQAKLVKIIIFTK